MPRAAAARPTLRLVFPASIAGRAAAAPPPRAARRAAAAETLAAALLPEDDARAIFALTVARSLEGGRAAILNPLRRRRLVAAAVHAGLRPFDANLVIAIVQDAARAGEPLPARGTQARLRLVRAPERSASPSPVLLALAAVLMAAALLAAALRWLLG